MRARGVDTKTGCAMFEVKAESKFEEQLLADIRDFFFGKASMKIERKDGSWREYDGMEIARLIMAEPIKPTDQAEEKGRESN